MEALNRNVLAQTFKLTSEGSAMKALAASNIVKKTLASKDKYFRIEDIQKVLRRDLGESIPTSLIRMGLHFLKDEKLLSIIEQGKEHLYKLTSTERKKVLTEKLLLEEGVDGVLERHFSKAHDTEKLKHWFNQKISKLLHARADELIIHLQNAHTSFPIKETDFLFDENEVFDEITERSLIDSFNSFLESDAVEDRDYREALTSTMIAGRLIHAEIAADPNSIEKFRGGLFLLDTNILVSLALSLKNEVIIKKLILAIAQIEGRLNYASPTRTEYESLIAHYRSRALAIVESGNSDLLQLCGDDIINAALKSGCRSRAEFENFFKNIESIPTAIDHVSIEPMFEDQKLVAAIENAKKNKSLLQAIAQTRSGKRKRPNTIAHDACLIAAAEESRKVELKTWIITRDYSLATFSKDRSGSAAVPVVLSTDVLIDIFALHGLGPGFTIADFAPFIFKLLSSNYTTSRGLFPIEDISWFAEHVEHVNELSIEEKQGLLNFVHTARCRNEHIDGEAFKVKFNRKVRAKHLEKDEELKAKQQRINETEQKLSEANIAVSAATLVVAKSKINKLRLVSYLLFAFDIFWREIILLILILATAILLFVFLLRANVHTTLQAIVDTTLSMLALIKWNFISTGFEKSRERFRKIESQAMMLAEEEIKQEKRQSIK